MHKRHHLAFWLQSMLWVMAGAGFAPAWAAPTEEELAPGRVMAQQATKAKPLWITADHSQHEILKKPLASGPEVTKACLSCHNQAALQFHRTIHWTWSDPASDGKLGKGRLTVNNF